MCPGIVGLEGSTHGHDVVSVKVAVEYLESMVSKRRQITLRESKHQKMMPYSWAPATSGMPTATFSVMQRLRF